MSDTYVRYIKLQISDKKIKHNKKVIMKNNLIKSRAKKNMKA